MKIGLVSGEFPPMEGGVGAFTQELARALSTQGHEVHIITSRKARPAGALRSFSTRNDAIELNFAELHPRIERWRWPSVATVVDIVLRHELQVLNIQYQAAAYNMSSPAINLLPWRTRNLVKTIVTFHDLRVPYLFPKAGRLRAAAVNYMAKKAHGAIVTNPGDYQALKASVKTPLVQIPIGSNIRIYTPNHIEIEEARRQLKLGKADCLLAYFGFLNESKGAETLLHAVATLPERYHLVFIGGQTGASDPTNVEFLQGIKVLIAELGLGERVHWTGFVSDTRVSTFLHAADLVAMPYRDGASFRRGTLMAVLAHGRPLLTTIPSEPAPELQHGKNVWLIPADDASALAAAAIQLVGDPALRRSLGEGAAQTAKLFTWEQIGRVTAEFFTELQGPSHD